MNSIILKELMRRYMKVTMPTSVTATVQLAAPGTNQIILTGFAPGIPADMAFQSGVLRFTNNNLNNLRVVIAGHIGNQFTLLTSLHPDLMPAVGDTVTIEGGPLAQATTFSYMPDTVQNVNFALYVNISSQRVMGRGVARDKVMLSAKNQTREYDIQVLVEMPAKTGAVSTDSLLNMTDVEIFAEQALSRLHSFLNTKGIVFENEEGVETIFYRFQREGSPKVQGAQLSAIAVVNP